MKLRILAASLALVGSLAAACTGASGTGGTGGRSNPAPKASFCVPESGACGATTPAPRIDAQPPQPTSPQTGNGGGVDCSLTISPPSTGLTAGAGLVIASAYTYCTLSRPSAFTLQMYIEKLDPATGKWSSWPPPYTSTRIPPTLPAKERHLDSAQCTAGVYHLRVVISGLTGDKKPRKFGPATRTANAAYFTQEQCDR